MKRENDRTASDILGKEGNIGSDIQKEYNIACLEGALAHLKRENNQQKKTEFEENKSSELW